MKKRLDVLLVEQGLADTRTKAQALIMAGQVSAVGRRLDKPGLMLDVATALHIKDQPRFVSRAGEKLASVAQVLGVRFEGRTVLDVGSSTGGFTDYALQSGAAKVYCVDVGTAQLAYKLRQDPRVVVMEQTDIREAALPELADMAVMDVSFISLTKVLEPTARLIKPGGEIVAMVKPQFEAGKALADKHRGVIPMGDERDEVLAGLREWLVEHDFVIEHEADSGVAGAEGNVERFMRLRYNRQHDHPGVQAD
jgi:23S rRNA (cytidine1920-2'-O)/16S rRNA (cytidine1409-2'-O)-methyltransferase